MVVTGSRRFRLEYCRINRSRASILVGRMDRFVSVGPPEKSEGIVAVQVTGRKCGQNPLFAFVSGSGGSMLESAFTATMER